MLCDDLLEGKDGGVRKETQEGEDIYIYIYTPWVQSLSWEDPLEKGMATHSSILAWRIPWMGELGRLQSLCVCVCVCVYVYMTDSRCCMAEKSTTL